MISRLLKVPSYSNVKFMNDVYIGGFAPEFGVSILKQISDKFEMMYIKLGNKKQN